MIELRKVQRTLDHSVSTKAGAMAARDCDDYTFSYLTDHNKSCLCIALYIQAVEVSC